MSGLQSTLTQQERKQLLVLIVRDEVDTETTMYACNVHPQVLQRFQEFTNFQSPPHDFQHYKLFSATVLKTAKTPPPSASENINYGMIQSIIIQRSDRKVK